MSDPSPAPDETTTDLTGEQPVYTNPPGKMVSYAPGEEPVETPPPVEPPAETTK